MSAIIKKLEQLYKSYFQRKNDKRAEIIQHIINVTKQVEQANEELSALRESYITYKKADNWRKKYYDLYEEAKKVKPQKVKLEKQVIDLIDKFKKDYGYLDKFRNQFNKIFVEVELKQFKALLDNVEERPLDQQQRECIVKDEDNNLVIAGAGSGKTTTIVGKVKYLLAKNYNPKELLVLSFTNASAKEMAERIKSETQKNIDVMTFHKLGKEIIALVEGKQPSLTNVEIPAFVSEEVNRLAKHHEFVFQVSEFFLSYLKEYKDRFDFTSEGEYIEYLKDKKIKTLKNETVKSYEEMEIANYLFIHNVNYEYEANYKTDRANSRYRRYRPDFYLPDYDIYIEHFGIDRTGNVPSFFMGDDKLTAKEKYHEGIKWKRQLHKANRTKLIETYSYEKREGTLTSGLREKLERKGVEFNPRSKEELMQMLQLDNNEFRNFISLIATFITLMRTNGFNAEDVQSRNANVRDSYTKRRNMKFIEIISPIYHSYLTKLRENEEIDFSDMINLAAQYVQDGKFHKKFSYIIVDEYQDISLPRYNLIHAIKNQNNAKLFCVGDDWQSIYRFAGSDINLFTKFSAYFGYTETSYIETTYRFNKHLIDVSSEFILKNKEQVRKTLKAVTDDNVNAVELIYGKRGADLLQKVKEVLDGLDGGSSVLLLGRYNDDLRMVLGDKSFICKINRHTGKTDIRYSQRNDLQTEFLTVHRSKGLQADYVFILNNTNEKLGFPSQISDDKVLNLLLNAAEPYEHAEERRLFYVALTRAKRRVYLLIDDTAQSVFIRELERNKPDIRKKAAELKCPECELGNLIEKPGRYGAFYGCSNYPHCKYTSKIKQSRNYAKKR